jgi:hypothetical protein
MKLFFHNQYIITNKNPFDKEGVVGETIGFPTLVF